MDIKIVGKKKRKRKNVVASEFRLDVGAQGGDVNHQKEKPATDEPKVIPLIQTGTVSKEVEAGVAETDTEGSKVEKKPKKVSQVLQALLMNKSQSKSFNSEKERLQAQLSNCPDDLDTSDGNIFEEMPVEDFGMAMLYGMGLKPQKKKKKLETNKKEASEGPDPFIPKARVGRLGLGATSMEDLQRKRVEESEAKRLKKLQQLSKNNYKVGDVFQYKNALSNSHSYGRVISVALDTVKAVVGQSRKVMDVSLTDPNVEINVIPEASLPESHYIRSKGGVLATTQKTHVHNSKTPKNIQSSAGNPMSDDRRRQENWLIPNIRVRINHQNVGAHGSKYYAMKGIVKDVVQPKVCTLLMDVDGAIINDVKQEWLNSALPKKTGRVMVLSGKRKFKCGQMLLRDKKQKLVHVKLDSYDQVKRFTYDEVAEFLG